MIIQNSTHPGQRKFNSNVIIFLGSVVARLFYKIFISGAENVPLSGSVLVLSKHQSLVDIPIGTYALWSKSKRHSWAIMKDSLTKPPFRTFFMKCGGIPINRKSPEKSKSQFQFAKNVLSEGEILTIFPEQTLYYGKMGRGKEGGFKLITSGILNPLPVICVGFKYTKKKLRTMVEINIGKPRYLNPEEDVSSFFISCMKEIAELSGLKYEFKEQI